jgi:hypothetical protein
MQQQHTESTDLSSLKIDVFLYHFHLLQDSDHSLVCCSPCSYRVKWEQEVPIRGEFFLQTSK